MMSSQDILVVGGTGVVGRRVAALLAPRFPNRVVIAARNERIAQALADKLGNGARARRLDVDEPASVTAGLVGVSTVMMCMVQREPHLLRASIARGLAHADLAPRLASWRKVENMNDDARRTGARVLLGTGLSPGISNMMARRLANITGQVDRVETTVSLSLGDEYGPSSIDHFLGATSHDFTILEKARPRVVQPFSEAKHVAFPQPVGPKAAYLFPRSDLVYYPKTLGAHTAIGRFAVDPPWLGRLLSFLVRVGASKWLEMPGLRRQQRRAIPWLERRYAGSDAFGLMVTVEGAGKTMQLSLVGRHQADAAAAGAAEFARILAAGEIEDPGVWLPEQVVSTERFFDQLSALGWTPVLGSGPLNSC